MKISVIVDMQNDFIDGVLGSEAARAIVPKVANEIRRSTSEAFIFTMDSHSSWVNKTIEEERLPEHCVEGGDGRLSNKEVADAVMSRKKKSIVKIVKKSSFGAGQKLSDAILEAVGNRMSELEEIEIFGLCTDICVISNALSLRSDFPGKRISVRADLCAGSTEEKHKAALSVMESCLIDVSVQASYLEAGRALNALGFIQCENNSWIRGKEKVQLFQNMMSYTEGGKDRLEQCWGYTYISIKNNEFYNTFGNVEKKIISKEN